MLLATAGCAWENIPEEGETPELRLRITMEVQGQIDPNLFYFIVVNFQSVEGWNFSGTKGFPQPDFEGDERGLNWDVYYMYGNPRLTGNDFYRGIGGTTPSGVSRFNFRPSPSSDLFEYVPSSIPSQGNIPSGNQIRLDLDFGKVDPKTLGTVNLNMMVASLPFDRTDNPDDQYDALVYDSFLDGGVSLSFSSGTTDFNEQDQPQEQQENIGENPPPNANIVFWRVQIL